MSTLTHRRTDRRHPKHRIVVDGISFKNPLQANRYSELKALERDGQIADLKYNAPFPLRVNNRYICTYRPTLSYKQNGRTVLLEMDWPTDEYLVKKELVKALYGLDIIEEC